MISAGLGILYVIALLIGYGVLAVTGLVVAGIVAMLAHDFITRTIDKFFAERDR